MKRQLICSTMLSNTELIMMIVRSAASLGLKLELTSPTGGWTHMVAEGAEGMIDELLHRTKLMKAEQIKQRQGFNAA